MNGMGIALTDRFFSCISLGWFCGTASAMEKHGLRSFSGPFDWYFSDYPSVLKVIETDFKDFMSKENLEIMKDDPKVFIDKKYGFLCNHDIKEDFEREYPDIAMKYERRVEKFREAVKESTCFFRAIRSVEEVKFINENRDYIDRVIKSLNPSNVVVYLYLTNMQAPEKEISFPHNIERYIGKPYEMLTMFDASKDLISYCDSLLETDVKSTNLAFFRQTIRQNHKASVLLNYGGFEELLIQVVNDKPFYIWGAGKYGNEIADKLSDGDIPLLGFIDNSESLKGTKVKGYRVFGFDEVKDARNIFISVASAERCEDIIRQIHSRDSKIKVSTYSSLWECNPCNLLEYLGASI